MNAEHILLNHDMVHGLIMVYDLFAIRLSDNKVFGSKINRSISCLDASFDSDKQTFGYTCLGRCLEYIGPSLHLSLPETFSVLYLGMSIVFFFTTQFVLDLWGRCNSRSKWLSQVIERSLIVSIAAIMVTLFVLTVYHYAIKQYCGKCCTVGLMWLLNHTMPYCITFACITMGNFSWCHRLLYFSFSNQWETFCICFIADVFTIRLLTVSEHSPLSDRQGQLWLIAVTSSTTIYFLAINLLLMILYLAGYYDTTSLPNIDFETGQNLKNTSEKKKTIKRITKAGVAPQRTGTGQSRTDTSTRNILIASSLHKKSSLPFCQGESISKWIKETYAWQLVQIKNITVSVLHKKFI